MKFIDANINKDALICQPLDKDSLEDILINSKCKYSSAELFNRTYIIEYKSDNTFTNSRCDDNTLGILTRDNNFSNINLDNNITPILREVNIGYGTFNIFSDKNGYGYLYIKYEKVVFSEHPKSPMHPQSPFFNELINGYIIGPFFIGDSYDESQELTSRRNITQLIYKGPNNRRLLTVYKNSK